MQKKNNIGIIQDICETQEKGQEQNVSKHIIDKYEVFNVCVIGKIFRIPLEKITQWKDAGFLSIELEKLGIKESRIWRTHKSRIEQKMLYFIWDEIKENCVVSRQMTSTGRLQEMKKKMNETIKRNKTLKNKTPKDKTPKNISE